MSPTLEHASLSVRKAYDAMPAQLCVAGFAAHIDGLLKSPSTMDWILAAELRDGLEKVSPESPAAEKPTGSE